MEWELIKQRLIKACSNSKYCTFTIIQWYAPTNDSEAEVKEDRYKQLQAGVATVPQHDMNDQNRSDNTDWERAMGSQGCGTINNNGERLVNFCLNKNYVIGGTIFQHKYIHKLTWTFPDGKTVNQINHVVINNKWRRSHMQRRRCWTRSLSCDVLVKGLFKKTDQEEQHTQTQARWYTESICCGNKASSFWALKI